MLVELALLWLGLKSSLLEPVQDSLDLSFVICEGSRGVDENVIQVGDNVVVKKLS